MINEVLRCRGINKMWCWSCLFTEFTEISFTENSFTESRSYSDTVPLVPAPPHPTTSFVVEVYKCSV